MFKWPKRSVAICERCGKPYTDPICGVLHMDYWVKRGIPVKRYRFVKGLTFRGLVEARIIRVHSPDERTLRLFYERDDRKTLALPREFVCEYDMQDKFDKHRVRLHIIALEVPVAADGSIEDSDLAPAALPLAVVWETATGLKVEPLGPGKRL